MSTTMPELAFEGALGYGQYAQGGAGGTIIDVTNLNNSGPGSFREAVARPFPRTVRLLVSGTVTLETAIFVDSPYLTIDGSGAAVCLRMSPAFAGTGSPLTIRTHDVIVRYLRIRPGAGGQTDAITITSDAGHHAHDIIIDHCSLSWAVDKIFEVTGPWDAVPSVPRSYNITLQNCIVSEALHYATHDEGGHSKGATILHGENISILRNLWALNDDRNPLFHSYGRGDFINNVVFRNSDGWTNGTKIVNHRLQPGDPQHYNFVRNYWLYGPDANPDELEIIKQVTPADPQPDSDLRLYLKDNIGPHRPNHSVPENALYGVMEGPTLLSQTQYLHPTRHPSAPPFSHPGTWTGANIVNNVLEQVGATLPFRDSVDARVIDHVRNGTGTIIDDPSEVGGWPELT